MGIILKIKLFWFEWCVFYQIWTTRSKVIGEKSSETEFFKFLSFFQPKLFIFLGLNARIVTKLRKIEWKYNSYVKYTCIFEKCIFFWKKDFFKIFIISLNFNKKLSRIGRKKTQRTIEAPKKLFQKNLFGKSNSLKKKTR
jgi:hypothetical protein